MRRCIRRPGAGRSGAVRAGVDVDSLFFEPLRLSVPQDDGAVRRWRDAVGHDAAQENGLPAQGIFVDGGVISNFPIHLFHNYSRVPTRPQTFGVKLQQDERRRRIDGPLSLFGAIFDSRPAMRWTTTSCRTTTTTASQVQHIACRDVNWLDFSMDDRTRTALFREGAARAVDFLERFDWEAYRELRSRCLLDRLGLDDRADADGVEAGTFRHARAGGNRC